METIVLSLVEKRKYVKYISWWEIFTSWKHFICWIPLSVITLPNIRRVRKFRNVLEESCDQFVFLVNNPVVNEIFESSAFHRMRAHVIRWCDGEITWISIICLFTPISMRFIALRTWVVTHFVKNMAAAVWEKALQCHTLFIYLWDLKIKRCMVRKLGFST